MTRTQCARALGDDDIEVPNEASTMDAALCRAAMAASPPLVRAGFEAGVCATVPARQHRRAEGRLGVMKPSSSVRDRLSA